MSKDNKFLDNSAMARAGGIEAAKRMTPEQRKERSMKAVAARKCFAGLPKATHTGILKIGELEISCAVLENGRRVITDASMYEILGRRRGGRRKGAEIPRFLDTNNLKPLLSKELEVGSKQIQFFSKTGGKSNGFEATIIPDICKIFLDARKAGVLTESQLPTATRCETILMALAKVGITSLVDEAVGFQEDRDKTELQKLFNKFLNKELQPWTKRFPDAFFKNIKSLYGLEHLKGNPSFCGHIINGLIYDEISPEIREELQKRNPTNSNGNRNHRHHQLLTDDVGHPALTKQIVKVNAIMAASDTKEEFDRLWQKLKQSES